MRELRPWLYRIVHNTALNQLRVTGYDYDELRESLRAADAPEEEIERRVVVRQTLAGLAALPERQREALLQSAVEGRSRRTSRASSGCPTAPSASSCTAPASPCAPRRRRSRRCRC